MGMRTTRDRRGKVKLDVDKRWPDGRRLTRVVSNRTVGKKLLVRIEESIIMGTWRALREELSRKNGPDESNPSIADLAETYLDKTSVDGGRLDFVSASALF